MTASLVVLVSGSGTNLQSLLDACDDPAYGARVVAVGADRAGIEGLKRAERRNVPTFVAAGQGLPRPGDLGRGAHRRVRGIRPRPRDLRRLPQAGRAGLPRRVRRPLHQHPQRAAARLSGHPRSARRACVRRQGHRGDPASSSTRGMDTGPIIAQVAVPVLDDDTEETLTERIKDAERHQLVEAIGRMVREGWTITGDPSGTDTACTEERSLSQVSESNNVAIPPAQTGGRRPIRRALVSVYDKTGLEELVRALPQPGSRSSPPVARRPGSRRPEWPVTRVDELTGFPECLDGRVKTLHPKMHAGLLADLRLPAHVAQLARAGGRTLRPARLQPVPVHRRRSPPVRGSRSASSRSTSVGRRWSGPQRRTTPRWRWSPRRRRTRWWLRLCRPAGSAWPSGGPWPHGRSRTSPSTTSRWRTGARANSSRTARAGPLSPAPHCGARPPCGTARTRTRRRLSTPTRRRLPGSRRPASCTARRCRTTTTSTPTRPGGRRTTSPEPCVAIIKHANPCGIAVGADVAEAHRKAHACDPVSAYGGVDRGQPARSPLNWREQLVEDLHRGGGRALLHRGARSTLLAAKKNLRLLRAPAWQPATGGVAADLRWRAGADRRPDRRRR